MDLLRAVMGANVTFRVLIQAMNEGACFSSVDEYLMPREKRVRISRENELNRTGSGDSECVKTQKNEGCRERAIQMRVCINQERA